MAYIRHAGCEVLTGAAVLRASLFGIKQTSKALRDVAAFFGLEDKAEEIIEEEVSKGAEN